MRAEQRENASPAAAADDYREAAELARRMGAPTFEARAKERLAGLALAALTGTPSEERNQSAAIPGLLERQSLPTEQNTV